MRRLPVLTCLLASALLVTLALAPATAGPTTPGAGTEMSPAQAEQALAAARGLLAGVPGSQRAQAPTLAHGRAATMVLRDLWRAERVLRGDDRKAAGRMLARPVGAGLLDNEFFRLSNPSRDCSSRRFCVHYATSGGHATTAAFARTVSRTLDKVHGDFIGRLGYRKPVSDRSWAGSSGNPSHKFDVFLGNLGQRGIYGYCTLDAGRDTPYCALDNDFAEFAGTPLNALKATAAHEYFHAIQFAYDPFEDRWLMEGSAVWAEERAYDEVNDYLQYVRGDSVITKPSIPSDQDSNANVRVYASMLFFEHLTQRLGVTRMRDVWKAAQGSRYSLQAVRSVVSRHTNWNQFINEFGVWNSRPPGIGYAERNSYPGGRFTINKALGLKTTRTLQSSKMRRDHLSSGAIRLLPAKASTRTQRVRIVINGPNTARGAVASVQRRWSTRPTEARVIHLDRHGNATLTQPFGLGQMQSIVITFANASTRMVNCGAYGAVSYSCGGRGAHNDAWQVSARVIR